MVACFMFQQSNAKIRHMKQNCWKYFKIEIVDEEVPDIPDNMFQFDTGHVDYSRL